MGYNYTIKSIKRADCTEFLAKHHYLSQQGYSYRSGFNYGLYDDKDKLIGVAVFHTVSAWETVKGCFGLENKEQKGFWELGRFALDDEHHGRNMASWFLSRCIKQLRKDTEVRALISYADSEIHNGGLYAAVNFKYYGLTAPKRIFGSSRMMAHSKSSPEVAQRALTANGDPEAVNIGT